MNNNEYIDRVNDLLGDFLECEQQIKLLEQRRSEVKQELADAFELANEYLAPEIRAQVAHYWYWHTSLDVVAIGTFLGVHANYVSTAVGPLAAGYFCECGAEEMYTSRTARQTIDSARKGREFQCDDCREWEREQSFKNYELIEAERRAEIERLKSMPYQEYLDTNHWRNVRKAALRRAHYRCQLCSAKKWLEVHHNTYENRGEEKLQAVIALCRECHEKHHGIREQNSTRGQYRVPDEYSNIIIG